MSFTRHLVRSYLLAAGVDGIGQEAPELGALREQLVQVTRADRRLLHDIESTALLLRHHVAQLARAVST